MTIAILRNSKQPQEEVDHVEAEPADTLSFYIPDTHFMMAH